MKPFSFRFSISNLLLLFVVFAIGFGWWIDHQNQSVRFVLTNAFANFCCFGSGKVQILDRDHEPQNDP